MADPKSASGEAGEPTPSHRTNDECGIELPILDRDTYIVEGDCGQGGLGRVLRVYDRRLGRSVALKEMTDRSSTARERFLREVRLCARLEHPSIVPVHEAGRWPDGTPFYAMRLISGRSLKEVLLERSTIAERLSHLPRIIAVAEAIAYAHKHHVIHRDLKPANIMLGDFGETLVIDWGLGKDLRTPNDYAGELALDWPAADISAQGSAELTRSGMVVGTPAYMPPEQAFGENVDERADVYAIGAVLYHLLAGQSPYTGRGWNAVLSSVRAGPPPPLATRQSGVPRDLLTIVAKAMARDKEERYRNASELAADLRRFQTGQLVSAATYSRSALLLRWFKRNRAILLATALFVLLGAIGIMISVLKIINQRNLADQARRVAEERSTTLTLVQARSALDRDPTATLTWLKTLGREAFESIKNWSEVRDLVIDAIERGVARHVWHRDEKCKVTYGAFLPDGRRFAVAGPDRQVRLYDTATGASVDSTEYRGQFVMHLHVSPKGTHIAFAEGTNDQLALWDLKTQRVHRLPSPRGSKSAQISMLAFSPDGLWLLVGRLNRTIELISVSTAERLTAPNYDGQDGAASFSLDGRWVAFAGTDMAIHLWDLERRTIRTLAKHPSPILCLAFFPDGRRLLTGGSDYSVRIWDLQTGQHKLVRMHDTPVVALSIAPQGDLFATGDKKGEIWLHRLDRGSQRLDTLGGKVQWIEFSPGAELITAVGDESLVRLWNIATSEHWQLHGHTGAVYQASFSPNGKLLATVSDDFTARLWEVPSQEGRVFRGHEDDVFSVHVSPDGKHIVTASGDRTVRLWRSDSSDVLVLRGHESLVNRAMFSPDGRVIASGSYDETVRLWDLEGHQLRIFHGKSAIRGIAFSPQTPILAAAYQDGSVYLLDKDTAQPQLLYSHYDGEARSPTFSADGQLLATAGLDKTIRIWNFATQDLRSLHGHSDKIIHVSMSPTEPLVASTSNDQTMRLWTPTGQNVREQMLASVADSLAISQDGRLVALGMSNGTIVVEELRTGSRICNLSGHAGDIRSLRFSPDSRLLASGGTDREARLWDLQTCSTHTLHRHGGTVSDFAFAPDGRWIVSASWDRTAHLWDVTSRYDVPLAPAPLLRWLDHVTTATVDPSHFERLH